MYISNCYSEKRNTYKTQGRTKLWGRLALCGMAIVIFMGNVWAQSSYFVIKKRTDGGDASIHYLAHEKSGSTYVLKDATTFSPDCIWISDNTYTQGGTNKNYYFYEEDGVTPRFLAAPNFVAGGALALSTSVPPSNYLNNPEYQYYFYKWDGGLGRGFQYFDGSCAGDSAKCEDDCGHVWGDGQCWDVFWVSYDATSGTWKMSAKKYNLASVPTAGKYYSVSVTEYAQNITSETGGAGAISLASGVEMSYPSNQGLSVSVSSYSYDYIPSYISYVYEGVTHNYYGGVDNGTNTPSSTSSNGNTVSSYHWTISGEAASYLSFSSSSDVLESTAAAPTLYYRTENTTGHKNATITLTVTYSDNSTQVRTVEVQVKTVCQNPVQADAPQIGYEGVTVSWVHTAYKYKVYWREKGSVSWSSFEVEDLTSYTITGLDYETTYQYYVTAFCGGQEESAPGTYYEFTTKEEPGTLIYGAVFGGGRMADVAGKTEVVIINCDSISAVYGGNDIAGDVMGNSGVDGSKIVLGVQENDAYATAYNSGNASTNVIVGSVYGGGNGYYAYNGSSFVAASGSYKSHVVAANGEVRAMTQEYTLGDVMWKNTGTVPDTISFPSIVKTAITVNHDSVRVDSLFGGAKNAFVTASSGNVTSITVNAGTVFALFGGNNIGGTQGDGKHYVEINGTKTNLTANVTNTETSGYGKDFGIRYVFGGGNKVAGSTTNILIQGGQSDNVFAGGNSADVYVANVTVNCPLASGSGATFGNTYSNAISSTDGSSITVKSDYAWDGTGIYNVRTLFGGNNEAEMARVPSVTLTSGSVGTVYGGGNAGDMAGNSTDDGTGHTLVIDGETVKYSTHLEMNSPKMLVDYMYGGCRMSNVFYSTWVSLKQGHVGIVYGGCNISGDVGSTRVYDPYPSGGTYPQTYEEQKVLGATYVVAGAGGDNTDLTVYRNIFAGSNGYYDCSTDGIVYNSDTYFDDPTGQYAGLTIPTHNETNVIVHKGVTVKGDVYAGGNLARVGFDDNSGFSRGYPELIGLATVVMDGGVVNGNVYGGGNMASIFGSNEVRISGGTIGLALYGGNDRAGQVAEKSNRKIADVYTIASDGATALTGVKTYVGVSGDANITTVYGGGNGAYPSGSIDYCYANDEPIQSNTFVDIHINGGALNAGGGHIGTVYGGGNGVTVRYGVTVFMNVLNPVYDRNHVDVVFGGNNMGDLNVVPDILLLHGQVQYVYGGCNQGAMVGSKTVTSGANTYTNVGSYVRLLEEYDADGEGSGLAIIPTAKVTTAIYGGCNKNGVTNNSLVLVEGGTHTGVTLYGGSDISGTVSDTSQVVLLDGTVGTIYGGGNGNYDYTSGDYSGLTAPRCSTSVVNVVDGTCTGVFGGGFGAETRILGDVTVNVGAASTAPTVNGDVYGGSAKGKTNGESSLTTGAQTAVTLNAGTINGSLYGGGLGDASNAADVYGPVAVTVNGGSVTGAVYGCNNVNGAPQNTVTVDIYDTDHPSSGYALANVFGGGNAADYAYSTGPKVTVHNCNSSIEYVYGGGNAASVEATDVKIYGGNKIGYVFGGGHGDKNATPQLTADVTGATNVSIYGGTIGKVFGGSNSKGDIGGTVTVTIDKQAEVSTACEMHIDEVYGGGNEADGKAATITVGCTGESGEGIGDLYGGANAANVTGNISLNITGGSIDNVFGGNNMSGSINGTIEVGVNWNTSSPCSYNHLGNVYGAGNLATYTAPTGSENYPQVTIANGTVSGNVYGAGKGDLNEPGTGTVTGNPVVVIGDNDANHVAVVTGMVIGGGDAAQVLGSTSVTYNDANASSQVGQLFGGGNSASVSGSTTIQFTAGQVLSGIYGGCNAYGTVGSTNVTLSGGTVGTSSAPANVHGGGYGENTNVSGDVLVNVGTISSETSSDITPAGSVVVYGDVYGGSALGDVNSGTSNTTTVNLLSGTINGNVYGGGLGSASVAALVKGNVQVNLNGKMSASSVACPVKDGVKGCVINGKVFGCNNLNGTPQGAVTVHVFATQNLDKSAVDVKYDTNTAYYDVEAVYGGGNLAAYLPTNVNTPVNVIIDGCGLTSIKDVYGGGNAAPVPATDVVINGTYKIENLFGGGNGKDQILVNAVLTDNPGADVGIHEVSQSEYNAASSDLQYTDPNNEKAAGTYYLLYGFPSTNDRIGTTRVSVYGGKIVNLYGGSNTKGDVLVETNVVLGDEEGECPFDVDHVYGGSNEAYMSGEIDLDLNCIQGTKELFGGSKKADVHQDVNLTITGGKYEKVFGGNNLGGRIYGSITVNIEQTGCLPIEIGELYGGGKEAGYSVYGYNGDNLVKSGTKLYDDPVINIISCKSIGTVFGGGLQAEVVGDPHININLVKGWTNGVYIGSVSEYAAYKNTKVYLDEIGTIGSVYGGGKEAKVTGNTFVTVGKVGTATVHNVSKDVYNAILSGKTGITDPGFTSEDASDTKKDLTITIVGAKVLESVFGGGLQGEVTGTTNVSVKSNANIGKNVYGGGQQGNVGNTNVIIGN